MCDFSIFLAILVYKNPRVELSRLFDYLAGLGPAVGWVVDTYLEYLWGKYKDLPLQRLSIHQYTGLLKKISQRFEWLINQNGKHSRTLNALIHFNDYLAGIAAAEYSKFDEKVRLEDLKLIYTISYYSTQVDNLRFAGNPNPAKDALGIAKNVFGDSVAYDILQQAADKEAAGLAEKKG